MGGGKVQGQLSLRPVGTLVVRERMRKAPAVQSGRALAMGRRYRMSLSLCLSVYLSVCLSVIVSLSAKAAFPNGSQLGDYGFLILWQLSLY